MNLNYMISQGNFLLFLQNGKFTVEYAKQELIGEDF